MGDKVDREAVQRLIVDCEEAHAIYADAGLDGAEGARMMSEAARGLTALLAERDTLKAEMELQRKKEVEEVMWRVCHIEELEAEVAKAREEGRRAGLEEAAEACVTEYLEDPQTDEDDAYQRGIADCIIAIRALAKTSTPPRDGV